MNDDKVWHYLEINRGRYICEEHGSFCDSSDQYALCCPLCPSDKSEKFSFNPIDRGLQIMRNLQDRSARNASIVAGLFAAMSAMLVFGSSDEGAFINSSFSKFIAGSMVFGLIALALFLFSMSHMPTIQKRNGCNEFMTKKLSSWERHIVIHLRRFENLHICGIWVFGFAVIIVVAGGIYTLMLGAPQ